MVLSPRRSHDERIRVGESVVRVRPWPDDPATAQIVPLVLGRNPDADEIAELLEALQDSGYLRVRTSALGPAERTTFVRAGLELLEELYLLRRTLTGPLPRPALALRRPRHLAEAVDVDLAAFDSGWRLDVDGLRDACAATPHHRVRVHGSPAVGYAVHGRAGRNGFVQRLAVHPSAQRRGVATALLLDGMRWLRRRRATEVLVNTQVGNDRARALYAGLGFEVLDERLHVLGGVLDELRHRR
jgi:ribosomal protein S18 acetylase RimI-like enzyme